MRLKNPPKSRRLLFSRIERNTPGHQLSQGFRRSRYRVGREAHDQVIRINRAAEGGI